MAAAAARLLRRSFSILPSYKSVALSYSSFTHPLRLSRFSPFPSGVVQLLTAQLLRNPPFQRLTLCSAASAEDSDGDSVAALELSMLDEDHGAPSRFAASSVELAAGNQASSSLPAWEPSTTTESGGARFQQISMKKGDWNCPNCNFMNFARNFRCLECKTIRIRPGDGYDQLATKTGDWTCSRCGFMNFSKNLRCLHCREDKPASRFNNIPLKKGDWHCPECQFMNFAKNLRCLQCNTGRPLKQGEWHCLKCQFLNFSQNSACLRCQEMRPENPISNDWECPSCKYLNFERNVTCLKCKLERPMEKSGLGSPAEPHGSSHGGSHPNRDSLLFDDNLFGSNNDPSLENKANLSSSDDEVSSR